MHDTSSPLSLTPERVEWRERMNAIREAVLAFNGPAPSMHPDDVKKHIRSYEEDVVLLQTIIHHMRPRAPAPGSHRLTNEILRRIFMESRQQRPLQAPTILSHVCRQWREVALGCPQLWTWQELRRKEANLTRLSDWVKRAGELPLRIYIRCSRHTDQQRLLTWLQGRSHRIKALTITHMTRDQTNHLIAALPPLPLLHSLSIIGLDPVDVDTQSLMRVLAQSRAIVSLEISSIFGLWNLHWLHGFADKLVHLSLGGISHLSHRVPFGLDRVLRLISPCISLQYLECHTLSLELTTVKTVVLQNLVSLAIGDGNHACMILKYLWVPNLQVLHLWRRTCFDRRMRPVWHWDTVVAPEYPLLLANCLRDLHTNCSPKIKTVVWDHVNVGVVDVLKQCIGSGILQDMESMECHRLVKLDVDYLKTWATKSARSLRVITVTGCTIGPDEIPQANAPMRIRIPKTLGDVLKIKGHTQ